MSELKPTNEQQLLFNILKGAPPVSLEGVDTLILFDLFRRHRFFPLAPILLPLLEEGECERWKRAIRIGSVRTLGFISRLHEILETLHTEGIEVMPLKGPVLAQALYGDVSQRHMRDLDLLVAPGEMQRALRVLQESGYMLKIPGKELSARQWRTYLRHQYDVGLVHREQGSMLELHTRIAYPGLLGGVEHLITDDPESVEIAGRTVRCMSREGTFLYLAIHGAHHLFFRLFWLRDLAEALNRWELDHARILYMARQMGIERMLGVGLRLTGSVFGNSIPAEYQPLLKENDIILNNMEKRCRRAILNPRFSGWKSRLNVLHFYMNLKPGWRYKWGTLKAVFHRWYIRKFLVR